MKNVLLRFFIEGQAHVGVPRGAEMRWALNDPK
jgi:hypothetical protein